MATNLTTAEAIQSAITTLRAAHGTVFEDVNAVVERLTEILEQKGCEHFDSAVTDGKLTHLIDIIIDG